MSETHTPGPWSLGMCGNSTVVKFDGDDVKPIARVWNSRDESLIARAPDLLSEVERLRQENELLREVCRRSSGLIGVMREMAMREKWLPSSVEAIDEHLSALSATEADDASS